MNESSALMALSIPGFVAGRIAALWSCHLLDGTCNVGLIRCPRCSARQTLAYQAVGGLFRSRCRACAQRDRIWPIVASISASILFVGFGWLLISMDCQSVTEVRPAGSLMSGRLPFHLLLIFLLLVCTITDLIDYVIPDIIVLSGALMAIVAATLSGELQMIHIWVSWDNDLVTLYGPYLPEWMKTHQHLHGLAWSIAGLVTGGGLTWIVRNAAGLILGYPAVGFGDVTLMAMIGAFMGWQPVLCVLAIAPLAAFVVGSAIALITGRSFLALGPYLALAAVIVLCSWRWLWQEWELRTIFSHVPTVIGLVGGSLAVLCLLLAGVRLFRLLPTEVMKR